MPSIEVGSCLIEKYKQQIGKVIEIEGPPQLATTFYKIRYFSTGLSEFVRHDYVPYAYTPVPCPNINLPPRPDIKPGQCVEWTYRQGNKVKSEQGIVRDIHKDEATIELEQELLGVKGLAFHDIYELSPCSKQSKAISKVETTPPSVMEIEGRYKLTELKEMAQKANIDPRGDKDQLCRRLIKEGVIR